MSIQNFLFQYIDKQMIIKKKRDKDKDKDKWMIETKLITLI